MSTSKSSEVLLFGVNYIEVVIRLVLGGVALFVGLASTQIWPRTFTLDFETLIRVIIPVSVLGFSAYLLLSALITVVNAPKISLSKEGIRYRSLIYKQNWRWNEITGLNGGLTTLDAIGLPLITLGAYNLYSGKKMVMQIGGLTANVAALHNLVVQAITTIQKPKAYEQLRLGETLKFGRLSLNRNEMHIGKKSISLHEITGIRSDENYMMIYKNNGKYPWKIFGVGEVHNAALFTELANQLITQNPG